MLQYIPLKVLEQVVCAPRKEPLISDYSYPALRALNVDLKEGTCCRDLILRGLGCQSLCFAHQLELCLWNLKNGC